MGVPLSLPRIRRLFLGVFFTLTCLLPARARADVGLVIETPTGLLGFLSNVGHVSVWISHGCLDVWGRIRYCDNSGGLVLTSTAYWPNPGAAAIPAELFFLGTQSGPTGRNPAAWTATLGSQYVGVAPAVGAKYLGRAWLRSLRVLKFQTSEEEDRRVLSEMDAVQREYHYSYSHRNCAFYAQMVLQHYFGPGFHANRVFELGIDTPRAVERALKHLLAKREIPYESVKFPGRFRHAWRQPSRNICESAIFDPKYAVPLLMYQPYLYAGFVGCYGVIRITTWAHARTQPSRGWGQADSMQEPRLHAFSLLTALPTLQAGPTRAATPTEELAPEAPDTEKTVAANAGSH